MGKGLLCLVTQSCPTLCDPMDCSLPVSSVLRDSPGKNTGTGCHALVQGIFPTQGSNPGLPQCRQIVLPSELSGKPGQRLGVTFLGRLGSLSSSSGQGQL